VDCGDTTSSCDLAHGEMLKIRFKAHFTDFLPDEQLFTMTQNIPPFKTLPVPMDGNYFIRFVVIPMLTPFQPMHGLTETFCPYQLHLQNSLGFI